MGARLDCDSCEYPTTAKQDPQWKDDDIHYSNQMSTGTCVRHALAKTLARWYMSFTNNPAGKIKPKDLIQPLLTVR